MVLNYSYAPLKKDKELVLTAIGNAGYALRYAYPELQKDMDIVLASCTEEWRHP